MGTIATDHQHGNGVAELRQIPLSRIVVPDGFNPRGEVHDDRELEQLAESMRRHGCLQPVRVRATEHGDYLLVAGERRYRAAIKAALMELPAIVRPVGAGDEQEQDELLLEAVLENDQRVDLNPLARARGYRRLLDGGLTIKGVAEQLSTTQARVREHLRILKLPDALQGKVSGGEVPLRAVKALEQLAAIHPGLADAAAGEVLKPSDEYEPYTWADVENAPLDVALHTGEVPAGVYQAHAAHPISSFALTDRAQKDLTALEQLLGVPVTSVRFGTEELEQAQALGALHGEQSQRIIVGAELANQLAGDYITRCLKVQRANQRRATRTRDESDGHGDASDAAADAAKEQDARRAQREADRQARDRATVLNLELGSAIYSSLSRVKVDERALKLLACVDVTGQLGDIAMRGARYGFPGWIEEHAQRNGSTKLGYLERADAQQRATEYLAGASTAGEIAGRQLALVAMAAYADQQAVAQSNRCWHEPKIVGPWADQFDELLDELAREKLPAAAIAVLEPILARRQQQHEQQAAEAQTKRDALERLEGVEQRIAELAEQQLASVQEDVAASGVRWTTRGTEIHQLITARRKQLTEAQSATN